MDYLKVNNWERYQHYTKRNPPWIKLHNQLLDNYEYGCLQDASKLLLMSFYLLASRTDNHIPADKAWIRSKAMLRGDVNWEPLISAGFISRNGDASKVLADGLQDASKVLDSGRVEQSRAEKKVGASAPPEALTKEDITESSIPKIKDQLNKLTETLYSENIFPDAPKFKNQMLKQGKNPRAILHTFIRCQIKKPEDAWGYCLKVIQAEDGNYNERDSTKTL